MTAVVNRWEPTAMRVDNQVQAMFEVSSGQPPLRATAVRRGSRASRARLEVFWAWASLLVLVVCWDAAFRLDQHASPSRMRLAHAAEEHGEQRLEAVAP